MNKLTSKLNTIIFLLAVFLIVSITIASTSIVQYVNLKKELLKMKQCDEVVIDYMVMQVDVNIFKSKMKRKLAKEKVKRLNLLAKFLSPSKRARFKDDIDAIELLLKTKE